MGTTFNGLKFGLRGGRPFHHAQGLVQGYVAMFTYRKERKPVSLQTYKLHRRLKKFGSLPLIEVENELPPPVI